MKKTLSSTTNPSRKMQNIAKILGQMVEKNLGKDWLSQELKLHKIKTTIDPSSESYDILKKCPVRFTDHLVNVLSGEDFDFDDKSITKNYFWFFCDIVGSSHPTIVTKEQLQKIIVLNKIIANTEIFSNIQRDDLALVPTGDGIAIGFSVSPEQPLQLSIQIHKALRKYNKKVGGKNKLAVRIGIDVGPVYVIKDLSKNDNYWGPGIIMAKRVMDLAGDMHIFASHRIAEDLRKLSPQYKKIFHAVGSFPIKHGEKINLYNIYGDSFGNRFSPKKLPSEDSNQNTIQSFMFNTIDIDLKVLDPQTMLTHHTWTWNLINKSPEPRQEIFYYIEGDVPKKFSEMNVRVTDEKNNELSLKDLNVNKPLRKQFIVKLNEPVKMGQKKKFVKLEYDWEEPDRSFFYKLATNCKKFSYKFTIPKGIDIKNRVLKVDTEMGYKWYADPPSDIRFGQKNTIITWTGKNLHAYDAYKFEW